MKAYLATSMGTDFQGSDRKSVAEKAAAILEHRGMVVYCPWKYKIPHAWDYPNTEWAQMVFAADVKSINEADVVVVLTTGRECTAGTSWEAGYAYGTGKRVIVVEIGDDIQMSLMVSNGCYARVKGLQGLANYDFGNWPMSRTNTFQT